MNEALERLVARAADLLRQSTRAVALTGAGISTPSGIPDFRSPGSGLWETYDPLTVASIKAFKRRPQDFYAWIHPLAEKTLKAEPNPAHLALATLERQGPLRAVITQNIDMLHGRAGSQNVYEVHGHLRRATCMGCGMGFEAGELLREFVLTKEMPRCELCGDLLKPDITMYGEIPPLEVLLAAQGWAATCDLMIVAGSSLEVVPVADLPMIARQNGARLIIVNLTETYVDKLADVLLQGDVAELLPRLTAAYLKAVS